MYSVYTVAMSNRRCIRVPVRRRPQGKLRTVSSPCREMYLYTVAEAECCSSVEGEAAQERRVAVCIARGINWLSFDCRHAMDNSIRMDYIGSSGWLHVRWDLSRDQGRGTSGKGFFLCRLKADLCTGNAEGTQ